MSFKYVLDSYAWVEYFEGSEKGLKINGLVENEEIATSIISIAELSDAYARAKIEFSSRLAFIKKNSVILPLTIEIAEESGNLKLEMRKKHKNFGLNDAMIYLSALLNNAKLISGDKHFKNMKNSIFLE